jgi:hypothetical protein
MSKGCGTWQGVPWHVLEAGRPLSMKLIFGACVYVLAFVPIAIHLYNGINAQERQIRVAEES